MHDFKIWPLQPMLLPVSSCFLHKICMDSTECISSLPLCLSVSLPSAPSRGPLINRLAGVRLWWNSPYIWGWLVYDQAKPSRVYDLDTEQWPHTQALCINQLILRWCAQSNARQGEMGQRKYFGERDNLTSELLAKWVVENVICSLPN